MAKLKGPLMSMDARGQLGKSLVFLGWKGLKTVRSHVVPANPNTTAQAAQRTIMSDAVSSFHDSAFNEVDRAALNVLASIQASVMSGFNSFCKLFIDNTRIENALVLPNNLVVEDNTGGAMDIKIESPGTVACSFRFGSSATVMANIVPAVKALGADPYTVSLSGLTVGSYIYIQLFTEVAETAVICGIYKILVLP